MATDFRCPLCGSWYSSDAGYSVGEVCGNQSMKGTNPDQCSPEHPCPGKLVPEPNKEPKRLAFQLNEPPRTKWGDWSFDTKTLCLIHSDSYYIDLTQIISSAAMLDWIFQIQAKPWADAKTLHDLLNALDDILCPQENYCSDEQDLRPDTKKLVKDYARRVK
jgi:hypothetical protein